MTQATHQMVAAPACGPFEGNGAPSTVLPRFATITTLDRTPVGTH
jgi:hypothetical protein